MDAIAGIISLLMVVALGLIITRIATVALVYTGLSKDLARFQARSAFTGCGYTTTEAERIVDHPVRRRIVMLLMLLGNGVVVMAITSLVPVFLNIDRHGMTLNDLLVRLGLILGGLGVIWFVASSRWVDDHMSRLIGWALRTFARLELQDFHALLHLSEGFTVTEMKVDEGDWVEGKSLAQLRLSDEGIHVLGLHREGGDFVATPTGSTLVKANDMLIVYGAIEEISELEARKAGPEGDEKHNRKVREQREVLKAQESQDRLELLKETGEEPPDFHSLLHLTDGYSVTEFSVQRGDWVANKNLAQLRLADEGVQILGIHRSGGEYLGTPMGSTYIRPGDALVIYARPDQVQELDDRRDDESGDELHARRVNEQRHAAEKSGAHEEAQRE